MSSQRIHGRRGRVTERDSMTRCRQKPRGFDSLAMRAMPSGMVRHLWMRMGVRKSETLNLKLERGADVGGRRRSRKRKWHFSTQGFLLRVRQAVERVFPDTRSQNPATSGLREERREPYHVNLGAGCRSDFYATLRSRGWNPAVWKWASFVAASDKPSFFMTAKLVQSVKENGWS